MLNRRCVHGTHAAATFTFGSPRRIAASSVALTAAVVEGGDVPGAADDDDRAGRVLDGGADRTTHVRLALDLAAGRDEAGADGGHRVGDGVERGRTVAAVLDHVLPPAFRVGVTGRRGEIAERIGRRLLADELVVARAGAANVTASGRSIARTGTSCSFAQAIACHSGLNSANGANAARAGSATT